MTEMLSYDFMQRALIAAVLVGITAPPSASTWCSGARR